MTTRLVILGGSDWSDGAILYAADQNDTMKALDGALGEVKMFSLSMTGATTKAALQTRGWAICDGTTPASQGITSPTITTTDNMEDRFISMSNDETSGTTGGSATMAHTHPVNLTVEADAAGSGPFGTASSTVNSGAASNDENRPPFYEVAFFIKVKI